MAQGNCWQAAYCGTARVAIDNLRPLEIVAGETSLDRTKIKRLAEIFRIEGCDRYHDQNRLRCTVVPALWDKLRWLVDQAASAGALLKLPPGKKIAYLHGRHRLAAAYLVLPQERWWVVDFYRRDRIDSTVLKLAIHDFANSSAYADGTVFRNLRLVSQLPYSKWLARLGPSKRRDLRQLWSTKRMQPLSDAFDKLVNAEGLWQDFKIGTFHRLLTLQCIEELVHYLDHIRYTWGVTILGQTMGFNTPLPYLDVLTVRELEGRSPFYSRRDAEYLSSAFEQGAIFSWLSADERTAVRNRVMRCDHIIPSLHTFLEDTKWLEPPSKVLRSILPNTGHSVRGALMRNFRGNGEKEFAKAYRSFWLAAIRLYPSLSKVQPRRDDRKNAISCQQYSRERAQLLLAKAAHFQEFDIKGFDVNEAAMEEESYDALSRSILSHGGPFKLSHRCGRTYEQAFCRIRHRMYLDPVYNSGLLQPTYLLPDFAVFRDVFHAFFGKVPEEALPVLPMQESVPVIDHASLFHDSQRLVSDGWLCPDEDSRPTGARLDVGATNTQRYGRGGVENDTPTRHESPTPQPRPLVTQRRSQRNHQATNALLTLSDRTGIISPNHGAISTAGHYGQNLEVATTHQLAISSAHGTNAPNELVISSVRLPAISNQAEQVPQTAGAISLEPHLTQTDDTVHISAVSLHVPPCEAIEQTDSAVNPNVTTMLADAAIDIGSGENQGSMDVDWIAETMSHFNGQETTGPHNLEMSDQQVETALNETSSPVNTHMPDQHTGPRNLWKGTRKLPAENLPQYLMDLWQSINRKTMGIFLEPRYFECGTLENKSLKRFGTAVVYYKIVPRKDLGKFLFTPSARTDFDFEGFLPCLLWLRRSTKRELWVDMPDETDLIE